MEVTLAVVNILSTHQWVGTALSSLPSESSQGTCPDAWGGQLFTQPVSICLVPTRSSSALGTRDES